MFGSLLGFEPFTCLALCWAGIPALAQLLKTKDEGDVGNAALCLSHCTQVAGVCSSLAQTDIIKETLVWARDGKKNAVQQNCAILLAKLAQGDPK